MNILLTLILARHGPRGGAYAVTVDGAGIVWVNEIRSDSVVRLDPRSNRLRVVKLSAPGPGIRRMIVDAQGQRWYMGNQKTHAWAGCADSRNRDAQTERIRRDGCK